MSDRRMFPTAGRRLEKWFAVSLLIVLLAAAPFLIEAMRTVETSSSDVYPWFPEGTPELENHQRFERVFGVEDFWILTLEGTGDPAEIERLERLLREQNEAVEPRMLRRIRSSADLLRDLPPGQEQPMREALSGIFFDREGKRGLVLAESTDHGFRNRNEVHERIILPVERALGPGHVLRISGPGFLAVMADRETVKTIREVTPFTFLISALLAFVLLGDWRRTAIALGASGISAVGSIAVIHYSGHSLSHLLSVVPSLAQLVALSNTIHFLHYFDEALVPTRVENETQGRPAWLEALGKAFVPTMAASLTTVIGFLSLLVSSMPVVRSFAIFGAASVVVAMVSVLGLVPGALILLKPGPVRRKRALDDRLIPALERLVARHRWSLSAFLLILMVACAFGMGGMKSELRTESFFSEASELKTHFRWFEREFGSLQSTQLVGSFDSSVPLELQAETVARLHGALGNLSVPLKVIPSQALASLASGNPALLSRLASAEQIHAKSGDRDYWRITVFHEPYPDLANSPVDRELESVLESVGKTPESGTWFLTGAHRLFGTAQEMLMSNLLSSFLLAFFFIAPLVILFLRDLKLGLVAILPNLFPIVVFFGAIGFSTVRVDIATMIIASIAFGIAVDDTIHFLTALSREQRAGIPFGKSLADAYLGAGPAMLKTTLVISAGMLAFLLSDFGPSRRFAVFTSVVMVLAIIGDLLLLPALLGGPLARFFRPRSLRDGGGENEGPRIP